ncbi:alpha/beta hydrolase domain-containing protein [Flavisphingomonas formosensis]|uniref:alpha/beta hydrolase domain-containing protein n=1 Tax=Flavisphingomonas formosensis TaxID=861534 RepID=UPI0012FA3B60|nr:alpha/beta hydrolase domain-containing protein [Sphingomonas formosensis]
MSAFGIAVAIAGAAQGQTATRPTVSLEITSRTAAFGGRSFGERGIYETLTGVAHMRIDPAAPANRAIVDLDRAPRDAEGLVRYDVDVTILRPRDPAKARRVMLFDVANRGMKTASVAMNDGSFASLESAGDAGNGFLMRQGYTIVWAGWQGDVGGPQMIGARFPIATGRDGPITGRIATETIFDDAVGDHIPLPYPAASLDPAKATLTARQHADDAERPLPSDSWHFEDDRHVVLIRPADMDAGAIYRFSYVARDPKVMGLGFAAVRDVVSWLRHADADAGNPLSDIAAAPCEHAAPGGCTADGGGAFDTAIAFGASQSGRYLRDFLWQGFNRDLAGGRVFDGVITMIPGARRTFTNVRFSEPGRFSRQHEDHDVPGFDFPFTYATLRDPVTGRTDGLLARCSADGSCPRIFHVDTSGEFWQAGASLVGTGGTDRDIPFPETVRAFMIAGAAHAPGMTMPACRSPANPMSYNPLVRALTVAMVDWTLGLREPPDSRWPRIAAGELQPIEALNAPDLSGAGIEWPRVLNRPIAPSGMQGWPVLLPRIDADGNDMPGVRLPEIAAPNGTYLGWNLRKQGYAPGDLCFVFGSYIPFAASEATRGADPRPSLATRYPGKGDRETRLRAAAEALRRDRLLLDEDVAAIVGPKP